MRLASMLWVARKSVRADWGPRMLRWRAALLFGASAAEFDVSFGTVLPLVGGCGGRLDLMLC